jgi:thymidine kinase|nr:MAG TPA: Terminase [Bacteriophage sp.]
MEDLDKNTDHIRSDIDDIEDKKPTSSLIQLYEMPWREYLKHKNYDTDINNMCRNCQREQIKKYGEITIKCSGPKDISVLDQNIVANMNSDELEEIKQAMNPVYWAEKNIDVNQPDPTKRLYVNRWYQSMQIQCSASKKAIRCGRRSGKSYGLGIDIANRLVQNSNYQILVVTPFLSQAKELTSVVKKILRSLSATIGTWDDLVERSVTSPYQEIQMKNGSTFKAFTAGNDNANAVRGQGAHLIIIDEADFLTQEAFDSITAILMDKPNTEIICTSTPMGEGLLYKFANSKDYKEFHFPSFCIPHYNDDMDREFRNSLSMMAYIQEIMAEFGLSDNSVFDTDLVNRSTLIGTSESLHNVITNRNRYIVSLGCDWNADKVGTRICVIAYDKIERKIIIANLSNVRREGWTQVAAIDKIVELNRLYTPDYIYVDEGFGEANVQQLKLIAVNLFGKVPADHPDLRLRDVVPVNFSSTLELRDVMTGEIRKKYFKNFIVETTKRALETGLLAFKDPISAPIVEQMKNYIVKSRAANGREVYEAKNSEIGDHDLDAFMIALAGLQLNENSILDTRRYSNITILPLEKRGSEAYNGSNEIEKRSYANEEKYHRTVRVAPGISRRSSMSGGPMGNRGILSRETASTFMNRYRTTMRSRSR